MQYLQLKPPQINIDNVLLRGETIVIIIFKALKKPRFLTTSKIHDLLFLFLCKVIIKCSTNCNYLPPRVYRAKLLEYKSTSLKSRRRIYCSRL